MVNKASDDFLAGIHRKINRKKQTRAAVRMATSLIAAVFVTFQATNLIHETKMDDYISIAEQIEAIQPDYDSLFEISSGQAVDYLIDEMDMYDILQVVENDFQTSDLIETIIQEG